MIEYKDLEKFEVYTSVVEVLLCIKSSCVTILLDRSTISINWSHVSHFYAHFCILYFGLNYHTDQVN